MNALGIDCFTKTKGTLIGKLKRLKSTVDVRDGGPYWEGPEYSQVHIDTLMSESELDDWLYKANVDYVGTYERREE